MHKSALIWPLIMQFFFSLVLIACCKIAAELEKLGTDILFAMNIFAYCLRIKWAESCLHFYCLHLWNYLCAMHRSCWTCYKNTTCDCIACSSGIGLNIPIFIFIFRAASCWSNFCSMLPNFKLIPNNIYCIIASIAFILTVWDSGIMISKSLMKGLNDLLSQAIFICYWVMGWKSNNLILIRI